MRVAVVTLPGAVPFHAMGKAIDDQRIPRGQIGISNKMGECQSGPTPVGSLRFYIVTAPLLGAGGELSGAVRAAGMMPAQEGPEGAHGQLL